MNSLQHGKFTSLAEEYAQYRPKYSETVLTSLLASLNQKNIACVDVGAGTGIWTRMIAGHEKVASITAVEPDDNMRKQGQMNQDNGRINWLCGTGEHTSIASHTCDLVTMASSFHWVKFDEAMKEFHRILKPGGRFAAVWNPRYLKDNPVLVDIENKICELTPNIKRVSSGKSQFIKELTDNLNGLDDFDDLIFMEGRHTVDLTREQYLGAWRSVNDVQYQMGDRWPDFMRYVEDKIACLDSIKSTYLTRLWSVRKK